MDIIICKNLKEFRKDKGNTQEELAEFLCKRYQNGREVKVTQI